jgi:glycogen operon protein
MEGNERYYMDYTGCGNTLNTMHPRVLQLIMDSLRYWVLDMHVDGFRFDLASTLARERHEVDRLGAFLDIVHQDPVLSKVKLIAEPWDLGEGGYQVGNFPVGWTEWNGRYRDSIRAYWKGDDGLIGEVARRITGSSDLYEHSGRRPYASINFVTCHDGFTLHDLVSYNEKHNQANREENRDGENHNLSWNFGHEGFTRNQHIARQRAQQKRNLLATLLLSQGVPMLSAGDEVGQSQQGNNNAYCQDNELSWLDWDLSNEDRDLVSFVRYLIRLRREHVVFRLRDFFRGRPAKGTDTTDVVWLKPTGQEMKREDWHQGFVHCLGLFFCGEAIEEHDERGRPIHDDNLLMLLNSHSQPVPFAVPSKVPYARWEAIVDTCYAQGRRADRRFFHAGEKYPLQGRSLALLIQRKSKLPRQEDRAELR